MSYHLALIVASGIVTIVILRRYMLSPLANIPGPFLASITRLWYTYINWRGTQHVVLAKLHARYGDIVRVAPNEV